MAMPRKICFQLLQLSPTLRDPMDCGPPCSSVHGILQEKILEWVAIPPLWDLPEPEIKPSVMSSALADGFFTTSAAPYSCSVFQT